MRISNSALSMLGEMVWNPIAVETEVEEPVAVETSSQDPVIVERSSSRE